MDMNKQIAKPYLKLWHNNMQMSWKLRESNNDKRQTNHNVNHSATIIIIIIVGNRQKKKYTLT